jgi:thymidylate kinase
VKGPFNDSVRPASKLIVLSGLDGSGKSTQTALLAEHLRTEGIPATEVWNRWKPALSAVFIRLAKRYLKAREILKDGDYRGFTDAKKREMRSNWRRSLWQLLVWGEYAVQARMRLFAHGAKGTTVLCDRYVYDTLIDIAVNFSVAPADLENLMDHRLLSLFPKPAVVIFIDIDPETGAERKSDGTPMAYLADRRKYYASLARMLDAPIVNGGSPIESVASSIWDLTGEWRASRSAAMRGGKRGTSV